MSARLVSGIDGPVSVDAARNGAATASLRVDRGLKSGLLDVVDLGPDDLLRLAESALKAHRILTKRGI